MKIGAGANKLFYNKKILFGQPFFNQYSTFFYSLIELKLIKSINFSTLKCFFIHFITKSKY